MTEVLSKNLFALLGEDDDEVAPQVAAPAAAKKDDKRGKKPEAAAPAKPADNTRAKPAENRIRNEYKRGGFRGPTGDAPNGERSVAPRDGEGRSERRDDRGERGGFRGRGRGGGRGGRGGRGREFDRHSGNDRYDGEKKEVAGKGTWGDAVEAATDPAVQAEGAEGAAAAEGAENVEGASPAVEKEPEEVLKTYEQYQAELAAKRASLASVSVRKANEGADDGQWKDAVPLDREEDDEDLFAGKTTKSKKAGASKEKSTKVVMEIEQRFAADERERRGGGRGRGEGRGRGGEGRGRGRGGPRQNNYVNVGDESAFPSLGAK